MIRLYPRDFRRHYAEDLEQHFDDLVADRGVRSAWARTGLDLVITVPRYQMERIMTESHSNTTLNLTLVLLALGGVAVMALDAMVGAVLLITGLGLAMAQRSSLANALRVPDSALRRKRLRTAAVLGVVFVATYGSFLVTVGDSWTITDTALALVGTPAMVAAPLFLIAGLLTPHTTNVGGVPDARREPTEARGATDS